MRYLALDYGRRRIGVAVCDELGISITALGFIPRGSDAAAARVVAALARQEEAAALVVGMPINADGTSGGNVDWVNAFIAVLRSCTALPIHTVDERYTSSEAREILREEGVVDPEPGQVDAKAACLILRRHLDGEDSSR